MDSDKKYADVGVIVGRFQVHQLTEAHFKLIQLVLERHKKVIIFLGVSGISPVPSTKRNPLDFELRKQMLEKSFSGNALVISHLRDMKSDSEWSKQLDEKIKDLTSPYQTVMLYGGRDSFIKFYSGKFNTEELEPEVYLKISGTQLRDELKVKTESSDMFRAGVIWANENQYKHAIAVVDIAVFNDDYSKILLCRKSYETQYRFFGGFVDITDESYEQTAKREVSEETGGAETGDFKYVCSTQIHDWRYKNESDKVFTTLFAAKHLFGSIKPSDDIVECRWFEINTYNDVIEEKVKYCIDAEIVKEHSLLKDKLFEKLDEIKGK